jgi:phosphoglycolate phosphatase-like HAD superfamily hydrolase
VEAARAAGCPAILVSHGYETRPLASLGAYAVVDGLPEAGELLARWAKEGISALHRPV